MLWWLVRGLEAWSVTVGVDNQTARRRSPMLARRYKSAEVRLRFFRNSKYVRSPHPVSGKSVRVDYCTVALNSKEKVTWAGLRRGGLCADIVQN